MRNKSFKIAGFIVLAALLLVAYRAITANVEPFREIPSRIANFSAIEIDGGRTTFDEHKGKATLVVLSASWCPACIAELNTLKNLHKEFSAKGLSILMVSLMNALGNPRVIPVSYLVDSDGKFDYIEAGIIDENRMRRAIKALVK